MLLLIAVHFGVAMLAPMLGRWLRQRAFLILAAPPAATFVWLLFLTPALGRGEQITERIGWIDRLEIAITLTIGPLQWLLALVVSGIGALVLIYCRWYFHTEMPRRTAAVLLAFAGAMLGLVTADNLLVMYVFWELTTVFSYLLIGHNPVNAANRRAAMTALIVTTAGGLAMLVGVLMLGSEAGSYAISQILAEVPTGPAVTLAVVLLLIGAVSKSALIPFHFWLPGAMAAPTPVSAYLHAAAMVKAGVYLIALLAPAFATAGWWQLIVLVLGPATMLLGGWRALRQHDIKLLLAYGTVSQLGFMITVIGLGSRAAALAGCALLVGHALFKSSLFMVVGVVDHQAGTRDLRKLSGVGRQLPWLAVTAALAAASMAGLPPLFGFVAKEAGFGSLIELLSATGDPVLGTGATIAVLAALVAGSVLTVAYSLRFVWGTFATKPAPSDRYGADRSGAAAMAEPTRCVRPAAGFWLAPAVPAALGLLLGFVPGVVGRPMEHYADLLAGGDPAELVLWHGLTPALGLSALALGCGLAMFLRRRAVAGFQTKLPRPPAAEGAYIVLMRAIDRVAVETTAVVQRGSLPVYLGTIALVAVVFPGVFLLLGPWPSEVQLFDNPAQPAVGALMLVAAVFGVRARGRMKAILLVGATGYGTALLFLLHGAPDLALTQILVETVTLAVLTLVMRRLGPYFSDRPLPPSRWWRVALAIGFGAVASLAAVVAAASRTAEPVSDSFAEHTYAFGYGRNIVNITLVDTRAWDTLGELTVLIAAATGVASLIFLVTRNPGVDRPVRPSLGAVAQPATDANGRAQRVTWLRGVRTLSPQSRSIVMAVMIRLLFPLMVLCSLFLLFAGHNQPGGGFAAGLVTGLALVSRYLAGGAAELAEAAPVDAGRILGSGLLLVLLCAVMPVAFGGHILQSYVFDIRLGALSSIGTPLGPLELLGEIHLVTSLFFDIGVYLVVVGVMLDLARSLGSGIDELPRDVAMAPAAAGART